MSVYHEQPEFALHLGNSLEVLAAMPEGSVDSVVCDPPYELGFMGKGWDKSGIANSVDLWRQVLRVLKPGGHLVAFSGTRTYHRMACAIEDAGFEVRDQLAWVYGSGFPKSHNLDSEWAGWGTALKPSWEPICLARKPLNGTVAANVAAWGTGALNVAACRIAGESTKRAGRAEMGYNGGNIASEYETGSASGRWPANLCHDGSEEVVALFPVKAGGGTGVAERPSPNFKNKVYGRGLGGIVSRSNQHADSGSAARFFYCAKATRDDRDEGLGEQFLKRPLLWSAGTQNPGSFQSENTDRSARNFHPTVKPTELMRWLVRLVTPPQGLVLDWCVGSGSTGKACMLEGFRFLGVDLTPDYLPIAKARIAYALEHRDRWDQLHAPCAAPVDLPGQIIMFEA
jgi:site-specific DNA-methyltransferase (adenine-specific)